MRLVVTKKVQITSIIIVMILSSLTVLCFFQMRTDNNEVEFIISSDSSSTVSISDGSYTGKFEVLQEETMNSSHMRCVIIIEFTSFLYIHNLSFSIETEYILGSGRYSVSETKSLTLNTSRYTDQWQSTRFSPEGALVMCHSFANSSIPYTSIPEERQTLEILWDYNLTSTLTPRDDFECAMKISIGIFTYSNGLSLSESLSIIALVNVVCAIVIFELKQRDI